ncbi:MAG: hypothetical protein HYU68_05650 [Bacteroidetes bacterium]|nr:hypothetical protein [Bacteroidota bacterium]
MKKFYGIFLIIVMVTPFMGSYFWLKHHKKLIKKEVKKQMIAGMDKSELILLKFTKTETETKLDWKHSKEFEYNDQMFDVVEKETHGDTTSYLCWLDRAETKLNKRLRELVTLTLGNNAQNQNQQKQLTHFLKSLYCTQLNVFKLNNPINKSPRIYETKIFSLLFKIDTIPTPPPEIV